MIWENICEDQTFDLIEFKFSASWPLELSAGRIGLVCTSMAARHRHTDSPRYLPLPGRELQRLLRYLVTHASTLSMREVKNKSHAISSNPSSLSSSWPLVVSLPVSLSSLVNSSSLSVKLARSPTSLWLRSFWLFSFCRVSWKLWCFGVPSFVLWNACLVS